MPAQWRYAATPHAPGDARRAVAAYAREVGLGDEARRQVALAVSEAVTNVVLHAYPGQEPNGDVVLYADHHDGALVVSVRDHGIGLRPVVDSPGLGLGLPIITQVADGVEIKTHPEGGTELVLSFRLRKNGSLN